ncbi:hypothetical protein [Methylobacterium isbiliense]|jgi:hypothetical protein|uniref:Uncharacterized protein n=1 Tax=Methylobacterium isbiliense TaxID=315478 RepID=A0ABQ4S9P5_9HYPH|nr:hypothetical protein [Methylobacterium isbiliense]MDN3623492.1 hypothetical protein [Methylobacterium isbiliense]GJD99214.1 hypothetical protein GMJLKIPL_1130 [Methylobacterium isbiliense]
MGDRRIAAVRAASDAPGTIDIGHAPLIYFEDACAAGGSGGVGRILLTAALQELDETGQVVVRRATVAHLRGNLDAIVSLRDLLTKLEQAMTPRRAEDQIN